METEEEWIGEIEGRWEGREWDERREKKLWLVCKIEKKHDE